MAVPPILPDLPQVTMRFTREKGVRMLSISRALCLLPPGLHTPFSIPKECLRWQQGRQPAQPFRHDHTHQPGSHYSQPEKPQFRSLAPHAASSLAPRCGHRHCCTVSGGSIRSKQAGNEGGARQQVQTRARAQGNTGQHVTPLPPKWPSALREPTGER